jgi:flagellar basal-body rod protein FlgF
MDRMLYIAMTGAKESMLSQAMSSHNLANANTSGFRADLEAAQSMPLHGPGYASRAYSQVEGAGTDFTPGALMSTGRPLDVAVNGEGWIAVQAPDGSEAYSRAGDLRVDSAGRLMTGAGRPVLGNGGPIAVPPFEKLEIGTDGTLSIRPVGQGPETLAAVDRIKLVNPPLEQLRKGEDGLMRTADGLPAVADARVSLVTGSLESSNVNPVEAMVGLIESARQFEMQVKMMRAAEENDQNAAQLMRMS